MKYPRHGVEEPSSEHTVRQRGDGKMSLAADVDTEAGTVALDNYETVHTEDMGYRLFRRHR